MKEKTRAIYDFIEWMLDSNMPSPSYSEIAEEVGCSIGTIRCHLETLREAGLIEWEELKARTIRLVTEGREKKDEGGRERGEG